MNSDQWTVRLSEYLDDELSPDERAGLEEHLAACPRCAETLADLRGIVARAGALEDRPPARDLWSGIAIRIGVARPPVRMLPLRRRISVTIPQLAAAALVVAGIGAGAVWFATGGPVNGGPIVNTDSVPASDGAPVRLVSGTAYDDAVRDLERVLAERRDRLDSSTVRVLEESLATIDRAINRARAALAADPSDPYLKHHLAQAMRRKLDLLRRATDLVVS